MIKTDLTYREFLKWMYISAIFPPIGYLMCFLCMLLFFVGIAAVIEYYVRGTKKSHVLEIYMFVLIGTGPGMLVTAFGAEIGRLYLYPFLIDRLNQL